ncbi:LysR family transcriptional regulator [Citrobacter koseri]|uniref:LysR family transcriptional regulator n=1 Tax=Citrobacter koseri TaxID=545 RepID=A0A447UHN7_CITKO|nr:LysR family transcriptional regulator [Citrobacter koseri]
MKPLLDVLMILDALEKEGSFAAASAKLFKTPSALSYTVHKLESDLNIQLLDRSGHRAKFTRTGQMLLEKGREVLHTVRRTGKAGHQTSRRLGERTGHRRGRYVSFFSPYSPH